MKTTTAVTIDLLYRNLSKLKISFMNQTANRKDSVESSPEKMFGSISEDYFKLELELLDRYLKFSSELLRLSLLGIAVVGFILTKFKDVTSNSPDSSKVLIITGISSFALSSIFALTHRYLSTDAFRFF